jgi:hypothetical protein
LRFVLKGIFISVLFGISIRPAMAENIQNAWPVAKFYPETVGLLYPGFSVAAGVNPAAIPSAGSGTAIQIGFSPAPPGQEHRAFGSATHRTSNFGYGIGYQADLVGGTLVHNGFVGIGANFGKFNVGLGLRDYNLSSGISPSVDAGVTIELKVVDVGLVFYNLENTPRLGAAIGTRSGQSFNVEANVLLPPFNNLGAGYLATVSAQLAVQVVNAYFRTSYDTGLRTLSHTLGLGVWVYKKAHLAVQYSTPNRLGTAVTVSF